MMKKGIFKYSIICILVAVIIISVVIIIKETIRKNIPDNGVSKIIISEMTEEEVNSELNITDTDNSKENEITENASSVNPSITDSSTSDVSNDYKSEKNEQSKDSSSVSKPSYPVHIPTEIERQVLDCMNSERAKEGIAPLTYYGNTYVCAEKRAQETMSLWSHTRPNGKPSYTVYEDFGFVLEVRAGENLAKDFKTAEQIVAKLMTSEGHRKNIMQPEYHRVCICVLKGENGYYHMTQLFLG